MSPELERILAAMYEFDTCEKSQRAQWEATLRRLVKDALTKCRGSVTTSSCWPFIRGTLNFENPSASIPPFRREPKTT
jgi:hypothetical protein